MLRRSRVRWNRRRRAMCALVAAVAAVVAAFATVTIARGSSTAVGGSTYTPRPQVMHRHHPSWARTPPSSRRPGVQWSRGTARVKWTFAAPAPGGSARFAKREHGGVFGGGAGGRDGVDRGCDSGHRHGRNSLLGAL